MKRSTVLLLLLGLASLAKALPCAVRWDVGESYQHSALVFRARALKESEPVPTHFTFPNGSKGTLAVPGPPLEVHLAVEEAFLGQPGGVIALPYSNSGESALRFAVGEDYLIFAGKTEGGQVYVLGCSRAHRITDSAGDKDLAWLRARAGSR